MSQKQLTYCEHPVSIVEVVIKKWGSKFFCGSFHSLLPSKKVESFWTLKKPWTSISDWRSTIINFFNTRIWNNLHDLRFAKTILTITQCSFKKVFPVMISGSYLTCMSSTVIIININKWNNLHSTCTLWIT